jgi:hypothetical protein
MSLTFSPEKQSFFALEDLILTVNQHAELEGYAIVTARIKKSKLEIKRKA